MTQFNRPVPEHMTSTVLGADRPPPITIEEVIYKRHDELGSKERPLYVAFMYALRDYDEFKRQKQLESQLNRYKLEREMNELKQRYMKDYARMISE